MFKNSHLKVMKTLKRGALFEWPQLSYYWFDFLQTTCILLRKKSSMSWWQKRGFIDHPAHPMHLMMGLHVMFEQNITSLNNILRQQYIYLLYLS